MANKNKKPLIALLLIAVLGVVGVTFAYYTTTDTFENTFNTGTYKTEVVENFTSPSNWAPGTVTNKTISVTNKGDVDVAVRVSFEENWTDSFGTDLPLADTDGNKAAIIHFTDLDSENSSWTKSTENGVDYYYYRIKLAPNESSTSLIESVEYNKAVEINSLNTCTDNEAGVKSCSAQLLGYSGATYTLNVKIETVQYDQYKNAWNTSVTIY